MRIAVSYPAAPAARLPENAAGQPCDVPLPPRAPGRALTRGNLLCDFPLPDGGPRIRGVIIGAGEVAGRLVGLVELPDDDPHVRSFCQDAMTDAPRELRGEPWYHCDTCGALLADAPSPGWVCHFTSAPPAGCCDRGFGGRGCDGSERRNYLIMADQDAAAEHVRACCLGVARRNGGGRDVCSLDLDDCPHCRPA